MLLVLVFDKYTLFTSSSEGCLIPHNLYKMDGPTTAPSQYKYIMIPGKMFLLVLISCVAITEGQDKIIKAENTLRDLAQDTGLDLK